MLTNTQTANGMGDQTTKKLYAFFFFVAAFVGNPLVVDTVLSEGGIESTAVWTCVLVAFFFWCSCGVLSLVQIHWLSSLWANVLFAGSVLYSFLVMLMILDRIAIPQSKEEMAIVLPPCRAVRYQTTEFNCVAKTNSLGFRDREVPIKSAKSIRIIALGDSFTFGWGVAEKEAWPKVLEARLQRKGHDLEVLNLGKGGAYTTQYLQIARKAIPLLKPDIVILSLLQEDDLAQKLEEGIRSPETGGKDGLNLTPSNILQSMFRNTFNLISRMDTINLHDRWRADGMSLLSGANRLAYIRYKISVEKTIQVMLESGDLNPALISTALYFPERPKIVNDVDNPLVREAIQRMNDDVAEIAKLCAANNSRLVILAMPVAAYKNADLASYSQMGFVGTKEEAGGLIQDSIYHSIAQSVRAWFIALSDAVAAHPHRKSFYYKYDGHPTASGHEFVADTLAAFLDANGLLHGTGNNK